MALAQFDPYEIPRHPNIHGRSIVLQTLFAGLDVADFADRAVVFDRPDVVTANHIAIFVDINVTAGPLVVDGFPSFEQFQPLANVGNRFTRTVGDLADFAADAVACVEL